MMAMKQYQNLEIQKAIKKIGLKKLLWFKKFKNTVPFVNLIK